MPSPDAPAATADPHAEGREAALFPTHVWELSGLLKDT